MFSGLSKYLVITAAAFIASSSVQAGKKHLFAINTNPNVSWKNGVITIREYGAKGAPVLIQATGFLMVNGNRTGSDLPIGPPQSGDIGNDGKISFNYNRQYKDNDGNIFKVYDYTQQLGDPAVLSAAAFDGGNPVSLFDWLIDNGYTKSKYIIQPDFFSTDDTPMYVAVDLAKLGDMGALFASAHAFGDFFTIGADDMLPGLPGELFSTTLPVLGSSGWEVTPPPAGTIVQYGGDHATNSNLPEPASWMFMLMGFGGIGVGIRSYRRALPRPAI